MNKNIDDIIDNDTYNNNDNRLKSNTIRFLCNYKTHLQRQIQRYKDNYCNNCCDELSVECMSHELYILNAHIYDICDHMWENDYIEINEEMHNIVYCMVCHMKNTMTFSNLTTSTRTS
jgi:hypothetical protein